MFGYVDYFVKYIMIGPYFRGDITLKSCDQRGCSVTTLMEKMYKFIRLKTGKMKEDEERILPHKWVNPFKYICRVSKKVRQISKNRILYLKLKKKVFWASVQEYSGIFIEEALFYILESKIRVKIINWENIENQNRKILGVIYPQPHPPYIRHWVARFCCLLRNMMKICNCQP